MRIPSEWLPSRFRDPVADAVFLVGDAAGQRLPRSGVGIRPALVFGQVAHCAYRRVADPDSLRPRADPAAEHADLAVR